MGPKNSWVNIDNVELKNKVFRGPSSNRGLFVVLTNLGLYGLNLYLKPVERSNGMIFWTGLSLNKC